MVELSWATVEIKIRWFCTQEPDLWLVLRRNGLLRFSSGISGRGFVCLCSFARNNMAYYNAVLILGDESTLKHDSTIRKMNGVENVNGNSASIKLPISKEKPIIALENKTALNGEVDSFYEENSHKTPNKSKRRARSSVQTPENVLRERNAAFQRNYAKDVTRGEVEDMNEETLPVPRRISNSIQLGQKGMLHSENLMMIEMFWF